VHTNIQQQNKTQTIEKNTPKTTPTKNTCPRTHKKEHPPTPQPQEDPSPIEEKKRSTTKASQTLVDFSHPTNCKGILFFCNILFGLSEAY
jgi:gentisate 1,2-dioxygenase